MTSPETTLEHHGKLAVPAVETNVQSLALWIVLYYSELLIRFSNIRGLRPNARMVRVNLLLALASFLALKGITASSHNDEIVLGPQQQSKDDVHHVQKRFETFPVFGTTS